MLGDSLERFAVAVQGPNASAYVRDDFDYMRTEFLAPGKEDFIAASAFAADAAANTVFPKAIDAWERLSADLGTIANTQLDTERSTMPDQDLLDQVSAKRDDIELIARLAQADPRDLELVADPKTRPKLTGRFEYLKPLADDVDYAIDQYWDPLNPVGSYIADMLDVTINRDPNGQYASADIRLSAGGPGVVFHTNPASIEGFSVSDRELVPVDTSIGKLFDQYIGGITPAEYTREPAYTIASQATAAPTMQGAVNASAGTAATAPTHVVAAPTVTPVRGM